MKTTDIQTSAASVTATIDVVERDIMVLPDLFNDVEEPVKKPEVEPDKTPDENPGIITEPKPGKEEGDENDDDDDDDDYEPTFPEPEIGDDPDEIKTRTPIM